MGRQLRPRDLTKRRKRAAAKAKKVAKLGKHEAEHAAEEKQLAELLRALGAPPRLLAANVLDGLREQRPLPPLLALRQGLDRSPDLNLVLEELRAALKVAAFNLAPGDVSVSVRSFLSDYLAIDIVSQIKVKGEVALIEAWEAFAATIRPHTDENIGRGLACLVTTLEEVLLRHCRIDGSLYWLSYRYGTQASTIPRTFITLDRARAEPVRLTRRNEPRIAWRCGLPSGTLGLQWITWQPGVHPSVTAPLDVYVQSHALRHLEQRLPFERSVLQDCMWQSLLAPVLLPQGDRTWLVEFRLHVWKLGYFTVAEVEGKALVTTFLFLTMTGTPEGRELRRRLKLRADDIRYVEMDTLTYYTHSDVRNDAALREIIGSCGCGHLFEMLRLDPQQTLREGSARRTRKYLGMKLSEL